MTARSPLRSTYCWARRGWEGKRPGAEAADLGALRGRRRGAAPARTPLVSEKRRVRAGNTLRLPRESAFVRSRGAHQVVRALRAPKRAGGSSAQPSRALTPSQRPSAGNGRREGVNQSPGVEGTCEFSIGQSVAHAVCITTRAVLPLTLEPTQRSEAFFLSFPQTVFCSVAQEGLELVIRDPQHPLCPPYAHPLRAPVLGLQAHTITHGLRLLKAI